MKKIKRINKTVWFVLIILLVIEVLFDPLSPILHFSQSVKAKLLLPSARQKWESQSVTHYSYDVYAFSQICFMGANIEVDEDVVVHAGPVKNPDPWDMIQGIPQQNPDFPPDTWFLCDYKNYTVTNLFNYLEKKHRSLNQQEHPFPSIINMALFPIFGWTGRVDMGCWVQRSAVAATGFAFGIFKCWMNESVEFVLLNSTDAR